MKTEIINTNKINMDVNEDQHDFPYCKDWYMIGPKGQEVDVRELNSRLTMKDKLAEVMETIDKILTRNIVKA